MKVCEDIDFVLPWVDGSDPAWLAEKRRHVPGVSQDSEVGGPARFQDNGLLRYVFRGFERFAPWVHRVHFVTYGHLPPWLNTSHEKLHLVNHRDFMPERYLPTFNSGPLALNIHRIAGLSERFVYFNDDLFLVSPCSREVFFRGGLPCDMGVLDVIRAPCLSPFWHAVFNDVVLLNGLIPKRRSLLRHFGKWFNPRYGTKLLKNLLLGPLSYFPGFYEPHLPASYLRSSFEEVWSLLGEELDRASRNCYRQPTDVTEYLVRYYQLGKGRFAPLNRARIGSYCSGCGAETIARVRSGRFRYVCINNDPTPEEYPLLAEAFESILPQRSSYERF